MKEQIDAMAALDRRLMRDELTQAEYDAEVCKLLIKAQAEHIRSAPAKVVITALAIVGLIALALL